MAPTVKPPPQLNIPDSKSVVNVHIIDSTSRIKGIPFSAFMTPPYKGLDYLDCPAFCFLIENQSSGRKVLFDLGVRKDWENLPATIVKRIKDGGWTLTIKKEVAEILLEGGVAPKEVEAIIWSHYHWDHTGDPFTFPTSTDLIVGPGFKHAFVPGFPENLEAPISKSAYEGRNLREISFADSKLVLGRCKAVDFFGDGSFYLLDTPGHAIGHMCGLARTTVSPETTFILLGGDCAHHGGEYRPTQYLPLPETLSPSPIPRTHPGICPGAVFADIHHLHPSSSSSTEPFLLASEDAAHDIKAARDSVVKLGDFDAHENILTMIAHDDTMINVVGTFPNTLANDWKSKGWREKGMWKFLGDFAEAVEEKEGKEGGKER
ncbi:hypothetical protein HO133_011051 [Letharia lupina]|uniref:Metallo-beta-lactamase domain-containing protein n=1 Tax=Letharia lupina TaxID=560253 RepID=A0A8H6CJ58_9LECA|nr:uncharacterized protein HO133_011051 [Letharia lupina]KAF6224474.1 hypothetical protein HO133_011051 [Letharia lupina]